MNINQNIKTSETSSSSGIRIDISQCSKFFYYFSTWDIGIKLVELQHFLIQKAHPVLKQTILQEVILSIIYFLLILGFGPKCALQLDMKIKVFKLD